MSSFSLELFEKNIKAVQQCDAKAAQQDFSFKNEYLETLYFSYFLSGTPLSYDDIDFSKFSIEELEDYKTAIELDLRIKKIKYLIKSLPAKPSVSNYI